MILLLIFCIYIIFKSISRISVLYLTEGDLRCVPMSILGDINILLGGDLKIGMLTQGDFFLFLLCPRSFDPICVSLGGSDLLRHLDSPAATPLGIQRSEFGRHLARVALASRALTAVTIPRATATA